ncbi:hypothetical protein F511_34917 [Dorcoceras hygrometricum]|uniref:Uncharacterized protein n=1 Tax=Dorcoceras hygrometricum TaxID=472368 RepID=A0A2Z7CUJ6_9LAMI|nr:hypothetical protein F511_34917 [Dorcoceras hygrometricum]
MHVRSRDPPPTSPSHTLLRPPLAGALPAGPPPGPAGPNLTSHGPNHGRTREHEPWKGGAPRCTETCSAWCFTYSRWFDHDLPPMDHF